MGWQQAQHSAYAVPATTQHHTPQCLCCACCHPTSHSTVLILCQRRHGGQSLKLAATCPLQDGYRVARPRYISDDPVEEGSEEHGKLLATAEEAEALGTLWVSRLKSMAQVNSTLLFYSLVIITTFTSTFTALLVSV